MGVLLKLVLKIALPFVILGGLAALLFGLAAVFGFISDTDNLIELHNGLDYEVTARVDDEPPAAIKPHDSLLVRPSDGAHRLVVEGPAGVVEDAAFEIGAGRGWFVGFRGVYNIGGASAYAVVRRDPRSGKDAPHMPSVKRFTPPARFFALPEEVTYKVLNGQFYPTRAPIETVWGDGAVRLCSYDERAQTLGCPLCETDTLRCTSEDPSGRRPIELGAPLP